LTQVEEQTSGHIFEENVDQVGNLSSRWFFDVSIRAITKNVDDVPVLQSLQNLDLLLH
jgi:hypothetical protein